MSEAPESEQADFPDVGVGAGLALGITLVSAISYALIFVLSGNATWDPPLTLFASFGLGATLLLLSYIDLRTGLLPDLLTLPLIIAGLGYAALGGLDWRLALAGAVIGYLLIAGLAAFWRRTRGYEGIGLGDAKLLAAGGAWVGAMLLPLILLFASAVGLVAVLIVSKRPRPQDSHAAIPFGPALCFGVWICWCAGDLFVL